MMTSLLRPTLPVHAREIAGIEPAVFVDVVEMRPFQVAHEMRNAACLQMPHRIGRQRLFGAIDDAHLAAGQRAAIGSDHLFLRIALAGYGEARILGHTPAGEHVERHFLARPLNQQAGNRRARTHPGTQGGAHFGPQRLRQVNQIGKEGRGAHAEGRALALDQRGGFGG
jgi:hypothetical protein